MKDNTNQRVFEGEPVKKGCVSLDFIKHNNLSETSHPMDWFKEFISNKISQT